MQNPRDIKHHIDSVQGISKITRAMDVVSAAKAHRLQERVRQSLPFAERSMEVLQHLAASDIEQVNTSPAFRGYENNPNTAFVVVSGSRGMVGAYNHNILAMATEYIERLTVPPMIFNIGRVGRSALLRRGYAIHADYGRIDDRMELVDLAPLSRALMDGFFDGQFGHVVVAYTQYGHESRMQPALLQLLPITKDEDLRPRQYFFEPDAATLLKELLPRVIAFQLFQALLESFMSENTMRVIAMRQATSNAGDLVQRLSISYNKARQQSITSDLLDIISGSAALESR